MQKSKELIIEHRTDIYVVKLIDSGKIIAIRNTKAQAEEVAYYLDEKRKTKAPERKNKAWTRKKLFFICFCQEFDKTSGRRYPKKNWYQYDVIQPTAEWKAEMPKFYKWFCKANLRDFKSYDEIVKNYFSTKRRGL